MMEKIKFSLIDAICNLFISLCTGQLFSLVTCCMSEQVKPFRYPSGWVSIFFLIHLPFIPNLL